MKKQRYYAVTTIVAMLLIVISFVAVMIDYSNQAEKKFIRTMESQGTIQLESVSNHITHNVEFVYRELERIKSQFLKEGAVYGQNDFLDDFDHLGDVRIIQTAELSSVELEYANKPSHFFTEDYMLVVVNPIFIGEELSGAVVSSFDQADYTKYIIGSMLEFRNKKIHIISEDGTFLYEPIGSTSFFDTLRDYKIATGSDAEIISYLDTIEGKLHFVKLGSNESYWYIEKIDNIYLINVFSKANLIAERAVVQRVTTRFILEAALLSVLMVGVIVSLLILRHRYYRKTQLQVQTLENSLTGGILLTTMDKHFKILYGNDGFYSLLNFSKKEIQDMFHGSLRKLVLADDLCILDEINEQFPDTKIERSVRVLTADRGYIWMLMNVSRSDDDRKTVTIVLVDINETKTQGLEIQNLMGSIQGGVLKAAHPSSRLLYVSRSLCKMMGYTVPEFLDTFEYFMDLIYEKDLKNTVTEISKGQSQVYIEFRVMCKNDSLLWLSCNATRAIEDNGAEVIHAVVMDITEKINATKTLEKERARFSTFLELSEEAIIEYIVEEDLLISSKKSMELFGFPPTIQHFYKRIDQMDAIHPQDLKAFLDMYSGPDQVLENYQMDLRLRNRDQKFEWYNLKSTTLYEDGEPYKVITKIVNIDEQRKKIEKLIEASQRDSLTGLYNSGNITRVVNEYLGGFGQAGNHMLVILDLDDFKAINDRHGHAAGDELIVQFSDRLKEIFGSESLIGRVGGDEFIVLAKNCNQKIATEIIQDMLKELQKAFTPIGIPMLMTSSIGISMYPKDGTRYEELFRKADLACYQSKDKGKNVFTFFDKSMINEPSDVKSLAARSNVTDVLTMNIVDSLGKNQIVEEGILAAFVLISEYFKFSYAYVFEQSEERFVCTYDFYLHQKEQRSREDISSPVNAALVSSLRKGAVLFISDINALKKELPDLYQTMSKKKTKSVLVSGVFEEGELTSLVCFGSTNALSYPSQQEIVVLITGSRLIVSHLHLMKERQNLSMGSKMFETILKNQEINAYAVEVNTRNLLYASPRLMKENPDLKIGQPCSEQLHLLNGGCDTCPLNYLGDNDRYTTHIYDEEKKCWLGLTIVRLEWEQNKDAAMIYTFDITSYIEKVSYKDSLTGLYNLSKFILEGNILLKKENQPYYLLSTNIVDFAYISQTMGIHVGNQLLVEVSSEIHRETRDGELCCRSTNDKFFLLLHGASKQAIVRRLTALKRRCDKVLGSLIGYTTSSFISGVYLINKEDAEIEVAINKAELARKTSERKNAQMEFYEDSLLETYSKVKELENRMEYALLNDEFKLYFLPKYNINTGDVVGLEALTRWVIDANTTVYPDTFIPLFESNGFIDQMSYHMTEKICILLQKWSKENKPLFPVSINMSYQFLIAPDFLPRLQSLMEKYQIPPRLIEIELQETMFRNDTSLITETVRRARDLGFRIAIDDFGAGYSTLISLKDFPVQVIKLDRGFLNNGAVEDKDITIIKHIVLMGQELGIDVVSEGVETEEQLQKIRELGCNFAQGFYFDRPLNTEEIEVKLKKHLSKTR